MQIPILIISQKATRLYTLEAGYFLKNAPVNQRPDFRGNYIIRVIREIRAKNKLNLESIQL